jgi:hypothetical protein
LSKRLNTLNLAFQVSNLANASALLYHSYLGCTKLYGVREDGEPVVNWTGEQYGVGLHQRDVHADIS